MGLYTSRRISGRAGSIIKTTSPLDDPTFLPLDPSTQASPVAQAAAHPAVAVAAQSLLTNGLWASGLLQPVVTGIPMVDQIIHNHAVAQQNTDAQLWDHFFPQTDFQTFSQFQTQMNNAVPGLVGLPTQVNVTPTPARIWGRISDYFSGVATFFRMNGSGRGWR